MEATQTSTTAPGRLLELPRRLELHDGFDKALAALQEGGRATLDGVWGASRALVAAALARRCGGSLVVVCPKGDAIDRFCDDLALFTTAGAERFPAWEAGPSQRIIYDEIYGDRLRTLKLLARGARPELLVTSIQSLLQPTASRDVVAASSQSIRIGERLDLEGLTRWLAQNGFHGATAVELPGEYCRRGGILDVFAPDWFEPVRIELFDDEIESIRRFDVASQRSLESLPEVEITVLAPDRGARGNLADFLPAGSWVLLIEPSEIGQEAAQYLGRVERPEDFHSLAAVYQSLEPLGEATAEGLAAGDLGVRCTLAMESVERFTGGIDKVRGELEGIGAGQEVHVVCQTEAEVERLKELFIGTSLREEGRLHFPIGNLSEGFRLTSEHLVLLSGAELFHRHDLVRRPARQRRLGKAIDSFLDLREGDLVVHLAHGIGRYRGLKLLEKAKQIEEHLEIEFRGGTKIYVPASRIELVQKYIGASKSRPALATIGGKSWARQKRVAEAAVSDLAIDMLELQAMRASRPGVALAGDTDWQREFDASFPYHETPDQLAAIAQIKRDMQSIKPMDRLLCGDVGFGKTELAMRAAFKAVDNGHQVAVMAPTTILAEQHYRTFRERMAEFPFDIAKLSRFCTSEEMRAALAGLREGRIDIVIGTHRVASRDVQFHNLGLVIIDEEQRFGVEIKERLKSFRAAVDVLTLSATPIPRTLHMSLVGVRDISNLETAPEDRLAVETRVTRWSDKTVRNAILRELNRGGQVYFVHNRVQDIEKVAAQLREIVPEATLRIGHGQMNETELERVMVDFVNGEFDVLLATTIVESGLDIPNANTIFIDEAERYGLADLHQLRGRVGRYKHRAYCYLLIDPSKHLNPNAARRLRAIEEFSDMGAGFAIAMRDLEIRGAGNLLGAQQSGHIAAVGYELYCQLLEAAVRKLKKLPPKMSIDVDIDLPGEAYIPDEYVPDLRLKIDLYRRLARVTEDEQVREFRAELVDRFGAPPEPVERMLRLTELKMDAALWQIAALRMEERYLVFDYTDRTRVEQLARAAKGKVRVVDEKNAYFTLPADAVHPDRILAVARSVLRPV
jgi:transcription-repair coupling factor (superfamily II helicase)